MATAQRNCFHYAVLEGYHDQHYKEQKPCRPSRGTLVALSYYEDVATHQ